MSWCSVRSYSCIYTNLCAPTLALVLVRRKKLFAGPRLTPKPPKVPSLANAENSDLGSAPPLVRRANLLSSRPTIGRGQLGKKRVGGLKHHSHTVHFLALARN